MKWLFHRRSKRTIRVGRAHDVVPTQDGALSPQTTTVTTRAHSPSRAGRAGIPRAATEGAVSARPPTTPDRRRPRREPARGSSRDSRKRLQRRRAYSFSPGREDAVTRVAQDRPPVPPLPADVRGKGRSWDLVEGSGAHDDGDGRPTLRKRSAQDLPRRKSSKRRKEQHDREAQIRAMVASMPTRTLTDELSVTKTSPRDARQKKRAVNKRLQDPSSELSLPTAESINSSLSGMEENQPSYVLSSLSVLAPRPLIRYAETPKASATYGSIGMDPAEVKKRRLSDRIIDVEEALHTNRRIDELADDFDATELRELMERDQTRRDRKKLEHQRKLERKLARRQEKQSRAECVAAENGTPPPANMERGVLGREVISTSAGNSAVVETRERDDDLEEQRPVSPLHFVDATGRDVASSPYPNSPDSDLSDPLFGTARAENLTRVQSPPLTAINSPPMSPSMNPVPILDAGEAPPSSQKPASSRRSSGSSNKPYSWASIFKRASRVKRASVPSFSNTSRDSMLANQSLPIMPIAAKASTSSLPKRTMSKFREDLPETPLSPPRSRVHSPVSELSIPTNVPEVNSGQDDAARYGTPISARDDPIISGEVPSDAAIEAVPVMNQSLASIDSEGSWLSGRRNSKRSSQLGGDQFMRGSAGSLRKKYNEYSESTEELGYAEDEYFSRLSPGPDDRSKLNASPAGDEDDSGDTTIDTELDTSGSTLWGAVARTPNIVHRSKYAKSREGLLNEGEYGQASQANPARHQRLSNVADIIGSVEDDQDDVSEGDTTHEPEDDHSRNSNDGGSLAKAESIDLKKRGHVRHISAGSARILDLKRSSVDSRRASLGSRTASPVNSPSTAQEDQS